MFTSPTFLFLFFPAVAALYCLCPRRQKHALLFVVSILFYSWGDPEGIAYLLCSIVLNFIFGILIERGSLGRRGWLTLILGIALNVGGLMYLKYAGFFVSSFNMFSSLQLSWTSVHIPLGISFFTFHAISYLVDVWKKKRPPERSILKFGLYIAFFPQLLAGPIMRYEEFGTQLDALPPRLNLEDLHFGFQRLVLGLGKKTLLADPLSLIADPVFAVSPSMLSVQSAWMALAAYALQIYFDFSAYSDIAIGLGRLFGFRLPENFRTPYAALSVTDFWRRWHMSLLSWLREYVYIPLGGSRISPLRTGVNIMIVFTLSGLWHGSEWHFVFWGMYFGVLLATEKFFLEKWMQKAPRLLRWMSTIGLVLVGWVFFRSPTFASALQYLVVLAGFPSGAETLPFPERMWSALVLLSLGAVIVFIEHLIESSASKFRSGNHVHQCFLFAIADAGSFVVFLLSLGVIASKTYHPFLYFQF